MEVKFNNVDYIGPSKELSNINIDFKSKSINCIMGKSGSGKTILIELIDALRLPTNGNIKIGRYILNNKKNKINFRSQIGYVFQNSEEQFCCNTVKDEIEFGMKNFKKKMNDIDKHVKDALLMVGLDESYLNRIPSTLSSGEKRLVAIASILAFNPKIIILDEPTINLDNQNKEKLIRLIKLLKNRYEKTIIIVSNDSDFLLKISDYIVVLNEGKVVLDGTKYEVFTKDIEQYGLKKPKIIEFEQLVLKEKKIKMLYRDEINDLMKDVYRYVK